MEICNVLNSVSDMLLVMLMIIGIIATLVCIHCGSEYFRREKREGTLDSRNAADNLRRESEESDGITPHSVLYRFFFRN